LASFRHPPLFLAASIKKNDEYDYPYIMFCSISGEIPQEPVVSKKSGHIFERRLIEKAIQTTGTDPISQEALSLDDLLPIKVTKVTKPPRTATNTSIPGLLQTFQNEWDALMLETFNLKQQLDSVRQELSHTLYQHDAACRVIARLIKERDDARRTLAQLRGNKAANGEQAEGGGGEMEGVENGITEDLKQTMKERADALSKYRKNKNPCIVSDSRTDQRVCDEIYKQCTAQDK